MAKHQAEQKTNIVSWRVGDHRYDIDLFDFDGIEWRDAKRATGMTQPALLTSALLEGDFEATAALVWLLRRRSEPTLEYEDVLRSLSYGSTTREVGPGGGDADPPAGAGASSGNTGQPSAVSMDSTPGTTSE